MFMKSRVLSSRVGALRALVAGLCLMPSLLLAHPGHYHPGEEDEFDFFRATFFHSHGSYDFLLVAVVLAAAVLVCVSRNASVRLGALVAAMGSLALVPVL